MLNDSSDSERDWSYLALIQRLLKGESAHETVNAKNTRTNSRSYVWNGICKWNTKPTEKLPIHLLKETEQQGNDASTAASCFRLFLLYHCHGQLLLVNGTQNQQINSQSIY